MYFAYNGYYFKLKALKDYNYLSKEELSQFKWNIVINLYNYLYNKGKLHLFNELTSINTKQQNELIMKSIIIPEPYLQVYTESHK
jgi:hypothetical protein